ncbi:uncharacterized protein PHA67_003673 isoform 2-T2 [Liasis olivaceus]
MKFAKFFRFRRHFRVDSEVRQIISRDFFKKRVTLAQVLHISCVSTMEEEHWADLVCRMAAFGVPVTTEDRSLQGVHFALFLSVTGSLAPRDDLSRTFGPKF